MKTDTALFDLSRNELLPVVETIAGEPVEQFDVLSRFMNGPTTVSVATRSVPDSKSVHEQVRQ